MNLSVILACVGAGISFFGVFQYFKGILYDGTKPRMASWAAWLTANTVFTIVAFQEGSMLAVGINAASALSNALIIGASLRQGVSMKPTDNMDWSCLVASVLCVLTVLIMPDTKLLGAFMAMMANIIATIPTLRHAWASPHEETWQFFAANILASSLGCIGVVLVSGFEIAATAGPLIATVGNVSMLLITIGRGWMTTVEEEIIEDVQRLEEVLIPIKEEMSSD